MLCDKCNKNEANVHITRIVNGVKVEQNLCSECAGADAGSIFSGFEDMFRSFRELSLVGSPRLSSMARGISSGRQRVDSTQAFEELGLSFPKIGQDSGADDTILAEVDVPTLKQRLDDALLKEDYEQAAELRDKIYRLEHNKDSENE